jgi:DNA-directed RNA polymerase subunit RPC12/RpoP
MELEYDLGQEVDEQKIEAGGKLPAGWYLAEVDDVFPDPANPALKIVYKITQGPYTSRTVSDTIWDPSASDTTEKAKSAQDKMNMVGGRIGARAEKTTKFNWLAAIGRPVVIQLAYPAEHWCDRCDRKVTERGVRKCPDCGEKLSWKEVTTGFANVTYDGVYPPDHEKLSDAIRKELGITVPRRAKDGGAPKTAASAAPTTKPPHSNGSPQTTTSTPQQTSLPGISQPTREQRLAAAIADI